MDRTASRSSVAAEQIAHEQATLDELHERLEALRRRTGERLAATYRQPVTGTHQSRIERDAFAARDLQRLARLSGVEGSLYFGAIDVEDGEHFRIGRVALADEDHDAVLLDWRAPAARPFYTATAARPEGVRRRRHIRSRRRRVLSVDDDLLDDTASTDDAVIVSGEAALLAALRERRTGQMSDIVATIQAEQDRIIRADDTGILVVQGAPGTGKTVAALHRAAYLLYTHRERLSERGVLVIGPNPTFLHYIGQVLPSLGETGVVLSTITGLRDGYADAPEESPEAAAMKGDGRMADVIERAVKELSVVPEEDLTIEVDGRTLVVSRELAQRARTRGRRTRRPHNEARASVVREVLDDLAGQRAGQDRGFYDEDDLAELRAELAAEPTVRAVLDRLWPRIDAESLVHQILSERRWATRLNRTLGAGSASVLARDPQADPADPSTWTAADVPLLDEAAHLLGPVTAGRGTSSAERAAAARRAADIDFAEDLLAGLDLVMPVRAEEIADRYAGPLQAITTAERARRDQSWTFGHVIVDEAQELSPMAWRMLARRCPTLSMTVVGDIAQTSASSGAVSWAEVLEPVAPGRWRIAELTVNYRTPAAVMDVASGVLEVLRPGTQPPRSVRAGGTPPWSRRVTAEQWETALVAAVEQLVDDVGEGRGVVITPTSLTVDTGSLLTDAVPGVATGSDPEVLAAPVAVLDVVACKGLEFDAVLILEPAALLAESGHGLHDLYVALTRTTDLLGVLHREPLPEVLRGLQGR